MANNAVLTGSARNVLIVGAGISGIGAAYHLRERFPDKSLVVLDALDGHGGTWRLGRLDAATGLRLAMETEDHPLSYGDFEGHIPDEEYGGGDSLLWESGTYETVPPGQERAQRERGHLEVVLRGQKRPESVKSGQVETHGPVKKGVRKVRAPAPVPEAKPVRVTKRPAARKARRPATPEKLLEAVWPPMLARLSTPEESGDVRRLPRGGGAEGREARVREPPGQ